MEVVSSQVWVHIPKKKRVKLDIWSWQGIVIDYKDINQYWIYNSHIGKIYIIQDFFINKQHLYHWEALNNKEYLKDDWIETDNTQFADMDDFNNLEIAPSMLPDDTFYLMKDDIFK